LRLNKYKLYASRTAAGKLFHTTGPATKKALSPNFVLVEPVHPRKGFLVEPAATNAEASERVDRKAD